jgi:hypothetical protein
MKLLWFAIPLFSAARMIEILIRLVKVSIGEVWNRGWLSTR